MNIPKHILTAASSWLSRLISAAVQIVCIRFIISSLGESGYATYALLSALITWTALFDFGIGNAVQNAISEQRAIGKSYKNEIVSSGAFYLLSFILCSMFFIPLSVHIAPIYLKSGLEQTYKIYIFYISVLVFLMSSFGSLIFKIWFAEQKGWCANLVISISSIVGLLSVFIIDAMGVKNKIDLIIILFFGPLALLSSFFLLVRIIKEYLVVRLSTQDIINNLRLIFRRSLKFWGFAIIATLVLQSDYLVISQKLSDKDIVVYVIMMKIFGFILFLYTAILQALWPVCVELRVRRNWTELQSLVIKYLLFGFILTSSASLSFYALRYETLSIVSKSISPDISWTIFLLFAVYIMIRIWCDTFAMLLQSMNVLFPLWVLVPIQCVISLSLQWYLSGIYGIEGVLSGLILSFVFTVFIFLPIIYSIKIRSMKNEC